MAIFLSNEEITRLLSVRECITALEEMFRQQSKGLVENIGRTRRRFGGGAGVLMGGVALGSKAYAVRHSSLTLLYNTETGHLDAVLEPGAISLIRTGAASGVSARYMANEDASVVGVIGTGRQAVTQVEAMCAVRPIKLVKAYSRTADRREQFAASMKERLGVEVVSVDRPEECLRGAQIVVAITSAREPVFDGVQLEPGTHVVAAGSNSWMKCEIDDTTIQRADLIVVDDLAQAKVECGELMAAAERGKFAWRDAVELHEVVSGRVAGRPSPEAITLFESQGIGTEDVAASAFVFQKAQAAGVGTPLPF